MGRLTGFGRLQTPEHLLGKLRHDYSRIQQEPGDEYAAFDFFVTAEHLLDWLWPGQINRSRREQFRSSDPLLEVTSHIASGVKHFVAEAKHHQSVGHADVAPAAFSDAFDPGAFQTSDELFVTLDGRAEAQFGPKIGVRPLGARILAFWENYFAQRTP